MVVLFAKARQCRQRLCHL